ncbi:MAG TPA: head-tail adaptor protein [Sphingomicrobium sp.]|jgi:head-tail adaptor
MPLNLNIGALDRRVTIVRDGAPTEDSWGQSVPGAASEVTRWAAVKPAPGTERFQNAENAASAPMHFFFRWSAGLVEPTDRLRFDGHDFEVVTPPEEIGRREFLRVQAVAKV